MNATAMVAEHLDERTHAVIDSWRAVLRRTGDVPRSESLTRTEFIDHVPALIDRMADRLRGHQADVAGEAEKHGHMRWQQGYDLIEVVAELGHLRTALTQATFDYARENSFDLSELEPAHAAINDVLNEVTAESVRQFQEDSQVQSEHHLASVVEAQGEAERERRKLRSVLDSLPVGVWVADADGMIVDMNREAEALQEYPADHTIGVLNTHLGTPVYSLSRLDGSPLAPEDIPLSRALRGEVVDQEELLWLQPTGNRVVTASAIPLHGSDLKIAGAVVVGQDVSSRKRLESDLERATAQFRGLVERSPIMIWRLTPTGQVDFLNQTFRDFFGEAADGIVRSGDWRLVAAAEDRTKLAEAVEQGVATRSAFSCEYRVLRHDGVYRWIVSRGIPYEGDDGRFLGFIGTLLDVTDQHELQAALQRQREMAEESSQHKTRLMAALSHDARTPLNAVVLSAQLLEMHLEEAGDPEVADCLRTIRNGVRNVLDLLGDMLDLTRIDAGAMPAERTRFSLEAALAECISSIETPARVRGLDCRFVPDCLSGLIVETDRAKLKQIVSNFLSNALRYTHRGHIRLRGDRTAEQLLISVEDSGIGIAEADQVRIFDEFATLESPSRSKEGGTGLGLAICRRLALLLGGEILIDSAPGRGSTFTLVLPTTIVSEGEDPNPRTTAATEVRSGGPIIVAEDHPDSRRALARVLRRMGYRVLEAADGREALEMAREERPLAILMDINMPDMNGIDATLAIRADRDLRDLAVFALTGDVSIDNQRRIGEAGVQGYLEKPVTTEALRKALESL
jgi:PAS domain S-box-containing protein